MFFCMKKVNTRRKNIAGFSDEELQQEEKEWEYLRWRQTFEIFAQRTSPKKYDNTIAKSSCFIRKSLLILTLVKFYSFFEEIRNLFGHFPFKLN